MVSPADRDVPSDVSSDSLTKSQIRGLTPDRLKEMFSDSTETYTLPVVETIVNGAPSYTDFYLVRKALEDVHGYMGDWTTEVLETDRIMDGLDGFAKEATLDYLDDEVIRTVLNNQMFFKLFIIDPDVLNGALSHFSGLHRQNFSELFKLRVTYQVRQKLAKAVVSEPEAISITEGEWEAIDKWPEILNNALFIKLVQGNSDIANTVLGNMPQWQTLVELGLLPKKLDEEVTHAVKGFGGGLGGDPVKRNTSYLWIPEPGRTGGGGTAQTNPNTTADEMSSENLRYAQELSGSGAFNVKFTGKGIHPKYGYEKIVRFLEQGDDPWCQDLWLLPLRTPRGRALTVAEMLLPMADSVDQTKSFFTEDLVSVASLKMKNMKEIPIQLSISRMPRPYMNIMLLVAIWVYLNRM